MYLYFLTYVILMNVALSEALFFWKDKPIFLCFKVCPLYCSKGLMRRHDEDSSSLIYLDEPPTYEPEFWVEDYPHPPPFDYGHWVYKTMNKPVPTTSTTTTMAPTMPPTTPEPTYICLVCERKCGYRGRS